MPAPRYVIYTPPYESANGGAIVMHQLCHKLNELGEDAVICPMPPLRWGGIRKRILDWLFPAPYTSNPVYKTPLIAKSRIMKTDIVVYPELVVDNPLKATNVVYWLLNRPSFTNRKLSPGPRDLFFKYDDRCDEPELTRGKAITLFLFSVNKTYQQTNFGLRQGSCYLIRKGIGRPMVHNLQGSIKIDNLNHEEISRIFNEREVFYSYDELSSYSQFAAVCGCTSVVIPKHFKDQAEFIEEYPLSRYGVAYGEENIPHAIATRHLVADYLKKLEGDGVQSVRNFIETTHKHFGFA